MIRYYEDGLVSISLTLTTATLIENLRSDSRRKWELRREALKDLTLFKHHNSIQFNMDDDVIEAVLGCLYDDIPSQRRDAAVEAKCIALRFLERNASKDQQNIVAAVRSCLEEGMWCNNKLRKAVLQLLGQWWGDGQAVGTLIDDYLSGADIGRCQNDLRSARVTNFWLDSGLHRKTHPNHWRMLEVLEAASVDQDVYLACEARRLLKNYSRQRR